MLQLGQVLGRKKEVAFGPPLFYGVLLFSLLQTTAWLLPNRYLPWASYYQEFVSASGFICLLLFWAAGRLPHAIPWLAITIFATSLIPLLQWASGLIDFFGDAFLSAFYLAGLAAAIAVGFDLRRSGINLFTPLASVFIVAALVSTYIVLAQWLEVTGSSLYLSEITPGVPPFGNLGQPNNLATLLYSGLLATAYFWHQRRLRGSVASLLGAVLVVGIGFTQSRTPWVTTLVITLWWLWKRKPLSLRLSWTAIIAIIIGYALFRYAIPVISDALLLAQQSQGISISSGGRIPIWLQLSSSIWSGPWYGYGWNQTSHAQLANALDSPAIGMIFLHSHNLFLELLIANGPVIGLLLIGYIVWWGGNRAHRLSSPEAWFAFAICLAFMTHAMLEFPLNYAYFLLPFGILLGVIEALDRRVQQPLFHAPRWLTIGLSATAASLLVAIAMEYFTIEEDFRLLRFESRKIGSLHAAQPAPDVFILSQLREYSRFARTEAHHGATEAELEWSAKVAHRYPYYPVLLWHALRLTLNGHEKEAALTLGYLPKLYSEATYSEAKASWHAFESSYPETTSIVLP